MTTTNLSSIEIAKLSAVITGGGYRRSNTKDAAVGRFLNIANGAKIGIDDATAVLAAADFEAASEALKALVAPATKPAKGKKAAEPKAAKAPKAPKERGKRAQADADAKAGKIPTAPDFSAETHKAHRKRLAEVVALVEARNLKALRALKLERHTSSRKAIARYHELAVWALSAPAAK
ncbi:hypothetical protein GGQ99_004781 [Aminobacter niigataensis]|uniref:Uncharacterized protein n=1 Tax=Aminobacter niigataensis TaxID=83265 RepID=A0ABR6L865_9HYPH|nr:hypothetical protein [Aminobacter niigataensis]MBB4652997.1 hypothetical protein [Aminobacter niigataensis]